MTVEGTAVKVAAVSVQRQVHIELRLGRSADTISGTVALEGQSSRPFHGWLDLIDTLEGAVDRPTAAIRSTLHPAPIPPPPVSHEVRTSDPTPE